MIGLYRCYDAIITKRTGAFTTEDGQDIGNPEVILYDATAINTADIVRVTNTKPVRRVSKGADVILAKVDDWCKIIVLPDGSKRLYVFEGVPFEQC